MVLSAWDEPTKLTPAQTLALYGSTIEGKYLARDGNWYPLTYSYYGTVRQFNPSPEGYTEGALPSSYSWDFRGGHPSGFTSWESFMHYAGYETPYLVYKLDTDIGNYQGTGGGINDDIPLTNVNFNINFDIEIAGIKYYDQIIAFQKYATVPPYNSAMIDFVPPIANCFLTTYCTGRTIPAQSYAKGWTMYDTTPRIWGWFRTRYIKNDEYGSQMTTNPLYYGLIRTYIDVLVNGEQQPFNVTRQELTLAHSTEQYLWIGCPNLTDGYVIPTEDESLTIAEINANTGKIVTQLDAVLAKLDSIYNKMISLNPSLTGAANIPENLAPYMRSEAFSSGSVNAPALQDAVQGASIIPVGSVVGAAGLGSVFGLLVALACAGWVLTNGRKG